MSVHIGPLLCTILIASAMPAVARADTDVAMPTPTPTCGEASPLPPNVTIEDQYLLTLTSEMARRSPTFRNQMSVLGAAPSLRARFRNTARMNSTIALAQTTFGYSKTGLLVADIQIPMPLIFARRDVEFIAHEVEHVIEQLEGVNLAALATKRGSGVYRVDMAGRPFETERAKAAGQAVDREYRDQDSAVVAPCETLDAGS